MIRLHKNPREKDWIGSGPELYKKGSFHNKLGMWLMRIFYGIVIIQLLLLVVSTFIILALIIGLTLIWYLERE